MSTPPNRTTMPPHRSFGMDESALDDENDTPQHETSAMRKVLGRISFGGSQHRPSFAARWRNGAEEGAEGELLTPSSERPAIPTVVQPSGEAYTTPLPVLSMIVLSIVRLTRFSNPFRNETQVDVYRPCLANSCPRTSRLPFCSSWSKVCHL